MKKFLQLVDTIAILGGYLSGLFMLLMVSLITLEIFLRAFFNTSTLIADEFSAYFMVWVVFTGLAYTFKEKGHIQINVLTSRIHNPKIKYVLEVITMAIALAISCFALYYVIDMIKETYRLDIRADSMAETPLWIPELGVGLGLGITCLQLGALFLKTILNPKK